MIVCVCHRVSDRVIAHGARAGMSFDDIQLEFGVATQCGQCEGCARDIVAQCRRSAPVAALRGIAPPAFVGSAQSALCGIPVVQLAVDTALEPAAWTPSPPSHPCSPA